MIFFFDTSALIKRYVLEDGSDKVDQLFDLANVIAVSPITLIEASSALKRLLLTKLISQNDYLQLKQIIGEDFKDFEVIPFTSNIEDTAIRIIEKYQLKTLDSIQLASSLNVETHIDGFVVSDAKLKDAAESEGFHVINPVLSQ